MSHETPPASTAPHIDLERENAELRAENTHLRARLAQNDNASDDEWSRTITYDQQPMSGAQFAGITKDREAIGRTSEHPE